MQKLNVNGIHFNRKPVRTCKSECPEQWRYLGGDHVRRDDVDVHLLEHLPALHGDEVSGQWRFHDT